MKLLEFLMVATCVPAILATDPCAICQDPSGCSLCVDTCLYSDQGSCAACWEIHNTSSGAFQCVGSNPNNQTVLNCLGCWQERPCTLCDEGSCQPCQACANLPRSQPGCELCWEKDANNFTCVSDEFPTALNLFPNCHGCWSRQQKPLVYTPGLTASFLNGAWKDLKGCKDQAEATPLWPLDKAAAALKHPLCYLEVMGLGLDNSTSPPSFKSKKGVNVTTEDFGGLQGLTFGPFLSGFLPLLGWREGENAFGMTFDWRYTALGLEEYYTESKALIEDVYAKCNNTRVTIISPSYGPQVTLGFLTRMTQTWKDKYVSLFVALSPVWSGATIPMLAMSSGISGTDTQARSPTERSERMPHVKGLRSAISGITAGASSMAPLLGPAPIAAVLFRQLSLHTPSLMWLSPLPGTDEFSFYSNETIVKTPSKNYTAFNVQEMLEDMGYGDLVEMFSYIQTNDVLAPDNFKLSPGIDTFVAWGSEVNTPYTFTFGSDFKKNKYSNPAMPIGSTNCSGDGVVPARSSRRGTQWADSLAQKGKHLFYKEYKGMGHADCIFPDPASPSSVSCFFDVLALILNGTNPS